MRLLRIGAAGAVKLAIDGLGTRRQTVIGPR